MSIKQYLGDSVYVTFDGYALELTTDNGYGPNNTIILEPEVWAALQRYVQWIKEQAAKQVAPEEPPIEPESV